MHAVCRVLCAVQRYMGEPGQPTLMGPDGTAAVLYLMAISQARPSEK